MCICMRWYGTKLQWQTERLTPRALKNNTVIVIVYTNTLLFLRLLTKIA